MEDNVSIASESIDTTTSGGSATETTEDWRSAAKARLEKQTEPVPYALGVGNDTVDIPKAKGVDGVESPPVDGPGSPSIEEAIQDDSIPVVEDAGADTLRTHIQTEVDLSDESFRYEEPKLEHQPIMATVEEILDANTSDEQDSEVANKGDVVDRAEGVDNVTTIRDELDNAGRDPATKRDMATAREDQSMVVMRLDEMREVEGRNLATVEHSDVTGKVKKPLAEDKEEAAADEQKPFVEGYKEGLLVAEETSNENDEEGGADAPSEVAESASRILTITKLVEKLSSSDFKKLEALLRDKHAELTRQTELISPPDLAKRKRPRRLHRTKEMDTPRSSGVTRRKDPEQELGDPQGGSPRGDGSKEKLLAMTPVLPKALQSKYKLDEFVEPVRPTSAALWRTAKLGSVTPTLRDMSWRGKSLPKAFEKMEGGIGSAPVLKRYFSSPFLDGFTHFTNQAGTSESTLLRIVLPRKVESILQFKASRGEGKRELGKVNGTPSPRRLPQRPSDPAKRFASPRKRGVPTVPAALEWSESPFFIKRNFHNTIINPMLSEAKNLKHLVGTKEYGPSYPCERIAHILHRMFVLLGTPKDHICKFRAQYSARSVGNFNRIFTRLIVVLEMCGVLIDLLRRIQLRDFPRILKEHVEEGRRHEQHRASKGGCKRENGSGSGGKEASEDGYNQEKSDDSKNSGECESGDEESQREDWINIEVVDAALEADISAWQKQLPWKSAPFHFKGRSYHRGTIQVREEGAKVKCHAPHLSVHDTRIAPRDSSQTNLSE